MSNEADTCRKYVVPRLVAAGWEEAPHSIEEQRSFTAGRIVPSGLTATRKPAKRADYLLRYTADLAIAVVEAKADYKHPATGLEQAKDYARILGLRFAYSTNGLGIVEFDFATGLERGVEEFPTPADLWARLRASAGLGSDSNADRLLTPSFRLPQKPPRYYQELAVNRIIRSILQGRRRVLVTMATGTGKTWVAFQVCWKLWSSRWNRTGDHRRPRILYLADRNVLVDDPKDKTFDPFGDARWKIEGGVVQKGREIYFALYQSLAKDESRPGLYREYARDFFDLVLVDECHRGSARDESNWREILDYFEPAFQVGMTATPLRDDNRDTYRYFGNPVYTYSLRQGIEDGFLAPYRVHRVITQWDAAGWRPSRGELDRYGREIPDGEYTTRDFERVVALKARTQAVARHLSDFMRATGRFAKTIVFCVDQEHALEMRSALSTLNADLVQRYPDYVCRVTSDEGTVGAGHLSRFQDVETDSPVILTTSQLLTTGVDAPTVQNVVLVRVIGSMTEFKQIIGRGTRVREDYGKVFFNILDYTGSATRLFADPEFDGDPALVTEEVIDGSVASKGEPYVEGGATPSEIHDPPQGIPDPGARVFPPPAVEHRKFYFDGGSVHIAAHLVYELDHDGKQLRVVQYTEYAGERLRVLCRSADELIAAWASSERRAEILSALADRGVDFETLAAATSHPDVDPLDLLCHVGFNAPLRTRRERAAYLRKRQPDFFEQYGPEAREVLSGLLDKYADHGTAQLVLPDALEVPPISDRGNVLEIARLFGGPERLREAVDLLQALLYQTEDQ